MAATNHPRKQCLPPPWARRGKLRLAHVPGGPAETARMILAGEWDDSPAPLLSAARYCPELVGELVGKGINAVALTWSPGFPHESDQAQWDLILRLLPLLKKKRIKAIARIAVDNASPALAAHVPEAQLLPTQPSPADERTTGVPPVSPSPCGRGQGEGGGTGCQPVNPEASGPMPRRFFRMDICETRWREYVTHKVRKAVEAGFDGLFFEGAASHHEAAAFLMELRAEARARRPADAPELLFYAPGWCSPNLDEICNLKFIQTGSVVGRSSGSPGDPEDRPTSDTTAGPASSTNVPLLKLAFEQGGRDKPFVAQVAAGALTDKQRRLAVAEIMAAGGTCAALDLPGDYGAFQQDCSGLFGPSDPVNTIGVIVEDAAASGFARPLPYLDALVRANIQFDMIPLTRFEQFDFRKYKLLIAAGLSPGPAREPLDKALNLFVNEHGGTTYLSPSPGREEFEASVIQGIPAAAGPQPVAVEAPEGVIALLWGKGTRRWVHLLNYRDEPCDASITLPGCGGRKVNAYSPDEATLTLRILEAGPACVSFLLSGIQTYAVAEVV